MRTSENVVQLTMSGRCYGYTTDQLVKAFVNKSVVLTVDTGFIRQVENAVQSENEDLTEQIKQLTKQLNAAQMEVNTLRGLVPK